MNESDHKPRTSPALNLAAETIAKFKGKTDENCSLDTRYHRLQTVATVFATVVSTLTLQLSAKGWNMPLWASMVLTALVLLIGAYSTYGAEMVKKHRYNERWVSMRPVLDEMIAEAKNATWFYGDYQGLSPEDADNRLAVKFDGLIVKIRALR